jgi:hypothetical protein
VILKFEIRSEQGKSLPVDIVDDGGGKEEAADPPPQIRYRTEGLKSIKRRGRDGWLVDNDPSVPQ